MSRQCRVEITQAPRVSGLGSRRGRARGDCPTPRSGHQGVAERGDMAALDRLRRDSADDEVHGDDSELEAAQAQAVMAAEGAVPVDRTEEEALRSRLTE